MVEPVEQEAPERLGPPQPSEVACRVKGGDERAACECDRGHAGDRRHRLVHVQEVKALPLEQPPDPEDRAWAEDDVRQRPVRGHDHRTADRDHLRRRLVVPSEPGVENTRKASRRIVADDQAHVEPEPAQSGSLQLRVLDDGSPERPRVRDDDSDLHRRRNYALLATFQHPDRKKPVRTLQDTDTTRLADLALLTLVVLLAAGCGGSSKSSNTKTSTGQPPSSTGTGPSLGGGSTKTSTSPIPTPTGPQPSTSSTPLANHALVVRTPASTTNLWPRLGGSLVRYIPGQVEGKGVKVLSVVKPDVIWVGRGPKKRILVHIRLKGEAAPKVHAGQTAHIIGQLLDTSSDTASTFGVSDAAGQALLQRQGAYVEVSIGDLRVS